MYTRYCCDLVVDSKEWGREAMAPPLKPKWCTIKGPVYGVKE